MILADTSIWIDHLITEDRILRELLDGEEIITHPVVVGELALGRWSRRRQVLNEIRLLPESCIARHDEVFHLIEDWALTGTGIGYSDAQLLASVLLTSGTRLWTRDRPLLKVAQQLSLAADLV
jgi:predicted nucleic acid-binding protein